MKVKLYTQDILMPIVSSTLWMFDKGAYTEIDDLPLPIITSQIGQHQPLGTVSASPSLHRFSSSFCCGTG